MSFVIQSFDRNPKRTGRKNGRLERGLSECSSFGMFECTWGPELEAALVVLPTAAVAGLNAEILMAAFENKDISWRLIEYSVDKNYPW